MTISQCARQLHGLSVGGYFNGEKFTVDRLTNQIASLFRCDNQKHIVMQIALPDGWWFFTITRYNESRDGFGWAIPETREQEANVLSLLGVKEPG